MQSPALPALSAAPVPPPLRPHGLPDDDSAADRRQGAKDGHEVEQSGHVRPRLHVAYAASL